MTREEITEMMLRRTKTLAVDVIKLIDTFPKSTSCFVIGKQLVKSASSTAANYRAVLRGRSDKEFFARLSIEVEECDETLLWLEVLRDAELKSHDKLYNNPRNCLRFLRGLEKQ